MVILSQGQASTRLELEKITARTPLQDANYSDGYTPDWSNISREYREKHLYTCEECGVDLSSEPYLLHTHHINRDKGDNREKNLIALCASCHKKQPYHEQRVSVAESDLRKLDLLREQQGLNLQ
ncbi:HNH endonuclease [Desulfovibrio sp. OttesenSCG-928-I05]|nr:HNH endonuclease [Desulfovibrio sp. OttesenSCG-928-I05]